MKKAVLLLLCFMACCCAGNGNKNNAGPKELTFSMVDIPPMINDPFEQVKYVIEHYWDNFDFTDTAYVAKDVTEHAFADFIFILNSYPEEDLRDGITRRAMRKLMSSARADSAMYRYFWDKSEMYLYEPNSPLRNEELYILVLQDVTAYPHADELELLRPRAQLRMAMRNRLGDKATDFYFTIQSGKIQNLYGIDSEYILLYINNSDCSACAQVNMDLQSSPLLQRLIDSGKITVVAVYPDEDIKAWKDHLPDMPENWVVGYDHDLKMWNEDIYDIKAIPTLYLLDRDKTVLIKDAGEVEQIERWFEQPLD